MNKNKAGLSQINILILAATAVIIALILCFSFFKKDDSSAKTNLAQKIPADAVILAERPHISQDQNSYYDLLQLKGLIPMTLPQLVSNYAAGSSTSAQDKKDLHKIVAQYDKAFVIFDQSMNKPYYFCDDRVKKEECNYADIRNIALLNSVRSGMLFQDGKYADAMSVSLNTLKLAQKLQNPSDSLIEYLVSLAVKRIALQRISTILQSGKISKDAIPAYLTDISSYTDNTLGQRSALKAEQLDGFTLYINAVTSGDYHTFFSYTGLDENDADMNSVITEIKKVKAQSPVTWNPGTTYMLLYQVYKNEIDNIKLPCGSTYTSAWHPDATLDYSKPSSNIIGQLLYATSITELNSLNVQRCAIDALTNSVLSTPLIK